MPSDYQPINCHYYDLLELAAMRRREVAVRFVAASGTEQLHHARIEDLWAKNGEEFMRLSDGTVLRLDQLRSVDGQIRPEAGCTWP